MPPAKAVHPTLEATDMTPPGRRRRQTGRHAVTECLPIPRGYKRREGSGFFGPARRETPRSDETPRRGARRRKIAPLCPPQPIRVKPRRRRACRPRTLMDAVIERYLEHAVFERDTTELIPRPVDVVV